MRVENGRIYGEDVSRTMAYSDIPPTLVGETMIPADTPQPMATPLPGFRCDDIGSETDRAGVIGKIRLADGFLAFRVPYEFLGGPYITCLGPLASGPKPGVGVVVGDFCEATRETSTITCLTGMTGSLAKAIVPTAAVEPHLTEVDATTTIFEGVTSWESVAGPPVLDIETATQTVTATHDGTRYVIAGFAAGPVFTHPENLSVTGTPPDGTTPVTVEVPSIDLNDVFYGSLLADVNGLGTEMRFADGKFDAMYVHATATGSGMAGEAGVMRLVPASAMAIDGANVRHAPLFDAATLTELETRGLTIDTILVGPVRLVTNDALFPGETIPIVAGRFHRFDATLLEPTPPAGECLPATADLALAVSNRASLCYDLATSVCGMQHQDGCGLSAQIGYFVDSSGDFRFVVDSNDVIVSSSHGTINVSYPIANRIDALPEDTDITIVIDMAAGFGTDHVQFTFRHTGGVVEILHLERVPGT